MVVSKAATTKRASGKPSLARQYADGVHALESRMEEVETWDTEAVFAELARLVGSFELQTHFRFDGYPIPYRGTERTFTYSIHFEVDDMDTHMVANGVPDHATIREAALYAMRGALTFVDGDMPGTRMTWDGLLARIAERTSHGQHPYVTPAEEEWLIQNDFYQPGHTRYRCSTRNEDLSDETQLRKGYEHAVEMGWS